MNSSARSLAWRWSAGVALAVFSALVFASSAPDSRTVDSEQRPAFWTYDKVEPDTIASVWLLRRVFPTCDIQLVPRGAEPEVGIPFDMPLVDFSRTRTKSTYHVIREHYDLQLAGLIDLERLIDEIEIGGWNQEPSPEAESLESALRACIEGQPSAQLAMEAGLGVLDERWSEAGGSLLD